MLNFGLFGGFEAARTPKGLVLQCPVLSGAGRRTHVQSYSFFFRVENSPDPKEFAGCVLYFGGFVVEFGGRASFFVFVISFLFTANSGLCHVCIPPC